MWVGGELPAHNPDLKNADDYVWLVENLFLLATESGDWCIDCGFNPEGSPQGEFTIYLWWYEYDEGDMPAQAYSSRSFETIRSELRRMIAWAQANPNGPTWRE